MGIERRFPVSERVGVPSYGGQPRLDTIQFDVHAGLTDLHFATLNRFTEGLDIPWVMEAGESVGRVQLLDDPSLEHRLLLRVPMSAVVEEFQAPSYSIVLAGLRALTVQSLISQS